MNMQVNFKAFDDELDDHDLDPGRLDASDLDSVGSDVQEDLDSRSILVVSAATDMANQVAAALSADGDDLDVSFETRAIVSLVDAGADLLGRHQFVVFHVDVDDATEMDAMRTLRDTVAPATRFLAVTSAPVTLATARQLLDVGFEEVLPLASVRSVPQAPAIVAPAAATQSHNGLIIAMSQTLGGLGTTSLGLGLASLLSAPVKKERARVALVDLDFQNGQAGALVDVDPNDAFMQLLKGARGVDADFVSDALVPYKDQFDILPAPAQFAPLDALKPQALTELLGELRHSHDYIILDLPRAVTHWIEPVLTHADQMLMVMDSSVASIRQARRLIDLYRDENIALPIRPVMSQEKRPFRMPDSIKEASSYLELSFDWWIPKDYAAATKARTEGMPIPDSAKRSQITKVLRRLADDLVALSANPQRRQA